MEGIDNMFIVISMVSLIVTIIFVVRWWGMTSDIKDIRNYLLEKNAVKPTVVNPEQTDAEEELESIKSLKLKMKQNQCIVKVKSTNRLEIWDATTWNEHVEAGKSDLFEVKYKNYYPTAL